MSFEPPARWLRLHKNYIEVPQETVKHWKVGPRGTKLSDRYGGCDTETVNQFFDHPSVKNCYQLPLVHDKKVKNKKMEE